MRLIDADALLEKVQFRNPIDNHNAEVIAGCVNLTRRIIDNSPTIDAVPVVRCKDCIHWYDREEVCLKIYSDGAVSSYAWQFRKPDDFCSYGERKDGDGNG